MKNWPIIADNLSKAGWSVGASSQSWMRRGEQSLLLTHIAATGSGSLCGRMKNSLRFWNWKGRLEPGSGPRRYLIGLFRSRRSQFLKARIVPQRIEHGIETEQRGSEGDVRSQ